METKNKIKRLVTIIVFTFLITNLPLLFIKTDITGLNTPFKLPSIIFPIVWSILYILMSISYYLVEDSNNTLGIYLLQLFFNSIWTILFFGFTARLLSFFWIIILFIIVLIMSLRYKKINKVSFYLLIPYLLWLIFAGYLNISIYLLN